MRNKSEALDMDSFNFLSLKMKINDPSIRSYDFHIQAKNYRERACVVALDF
jgi:hypothetical protein